MGGFHTTIRLCSTKTEKRIGGTLRQVDKMKIIKIAIGSTIAILIANAMGLRFSSSAGIITLLSIADTKKDTLKVAFRRIMAFFIALIIAFIVFSIMGYHAISFGVFLVFFVGICYGIQLQDGVSMCAVLTTHFLTQKSMTVSAVANEFALLLIGVGAGILFNMYMPSMVHMIRNDMRIMEQDMREILKHMGGYITNNFQNENMLEQMPKQCVKQNYEYEVFSEVEKHMKEASQRAYMNMNNNLLADTRYYIQYTQMRANQLVRLKHVYDCICKLTYIPIQAIQLAEFMMDTEQSFHEYNNVKELLKRLEEIQEEFKRQEIPKTRKEFENRAILYQIALELEEFLEIKYRFVQELTQKQIELFWKKEK